MRSVLLIFCVKIDILKTIGKIDECTGITLKNSTILFKKKVWDEKFR